MIDAALLASTFLAVFLAELPDKSMFAAVVMATRFRPLPVWIGIAVAFTVHIFIAAIAGSALGLLPRPVVLAVVTLLFAGGAAYLLFGKVDDAASDEKAANERIGDKQARSVWRVPLIAFGIIFVSEWGDLTQITTISRVAQFQDPLSVGLGALVALWMVSALGVLLGRRLVRLVPLTLIRRAAGVVFTGLALWSLIDLLNEL